MKNLQNPFEFEAAANLPPELVIDVYVEDHNYTRFIQSKRNVFLVGERGSGKSMTLLYNSLKYRALLSEMKHSKLEFDFVGIYIPCKTPLTQKNEHQLIDNEFHMALISENYLVLSILYEIGNTFDKYSGLIPVDKKEWLIEELSELFDFKIPNNKDAFDVIKHYANREAKEFQRIINRGDIADAYSSAKSFGTHVLPLILLLRELPTLSSTHFMLMLDDAHDLNKYQRRCLNSWIAYRDHSAFSFKVASAKVSDPDFKTLSGGAILDGHDFITIDMEQPFQNPQSPFGKLACEIIEKRLNKFSINKSAEEFFPPNIDFIKDLNKANLLARKEAEDHYPGGTPKQITDYVYKYGRAIYFRNRSRKANLPPYSGLDTLVNISTGVIRNLLDPCYWMFDRVYSAAGPGATAAQIDHIPPSVQTEVILERSQRLWKLLDDGLDKVIEECSRDQAKAVKNLFDELGVFFRERLLTHESEPRVITFTISGLTSEHESTLIPLINIARRAQLLYVRYGPSKDDGRREPYYVPNRMLWPIRGLDPNGQHGRASIKASDLVGAANGKPIPVKSSSKQGAVQGDLFNV